MFLFNKQIEKKDPKIKTITSVRDRPVKSIVKSISWRIIGTIDTIVISYFISGKAVIAFSIGSFEVFTKMFLYFLHERIWAAVRWGRMLVVIRRRTSKTRRIIKRMIVRT